MEGDQAGASELLADDSTPWKEWKLQILSEERGWVQILTSTINSAFIMPAIMLKFTYVISLNPYNDSVS